MRRLSSVFLSCSLSAFAVAQPPLEPRGIERPIGASIGGGDDVLISVTLPFSFPLPDGTSTSSLDVSTNGIIYPGGSGVVDPTESVAEFTNRVAIAPFWHDLKDYDGNASQVHFTTRNPSIDPTIAIITWLDANVPGSDRPFTFQAVLTVLGSIEFRYDDRFHQVNFDGGLVGVSDGSRTGLAVDLSELDGSVATPTPRGVFESFARPAIVDFGRLDEFTTLRFFPMSPFTGYSLTGDVVPVPGVVRGRRSCNCDDLGFTLTPSGSGYTLTEGADFDEDYELGTPLNVDRPFNVPFTSPFPVPIGSRMISDWYIASSGLLSTDSSTSAPGANTPVLANHAVIAPGLGDWRNFNAPNVWVHEIDASTFSVTWRGVRQWDTQSPVLSGGPPASTLQAIVSSDGLIQFAYEVLDFFVSGPQAFLIGISDGVSPLPGETDFSMAPTTSSVPVIYEFFDFFTTDQIDIAKRVNDGRVLQPTSPARLGELFSAAAIDPSGPQTQDLFLLGFPAGVFGPLIPLGAVDPQLAPCNILVDTVNTTPIAVASAPVPGGTPLLIVPMIPVLVGVELSLQAFIVNPSVTPGLIPTDELRIRFGI